MGDSLNNHGRNVTVNLLWSHDVLMNADDLLNNGGRSEIHDVSLNSYVT